VSLGHPTEPLAPKSVLWSEKTTCGDGIRRIRMFAVLGKVADTIEVEANILIDYGEQREIMGIEIIRRLSE
jgi:hypothetical protein